MHSRSLEPVGGTGRYCDSTSKRPPSQKLELTDRGVHA